MLLFYFSNEDFKFELFKFSLLLLSFSCLNSRDSSEFDCDCVGCVWNEHRRNAALRVDVGVSNFDCLFRCHSILAAKSIRCGLMHFDVVLFCRNFRQQIRHCRIAQIVASTGQILFLLHLVGQSKMGYHPANVPIEFEIKHEFLKNSLIEKYFSMEF